MPVEERDLKINSLEINQKNMAEQLVEFKKENNERFDKVDKSFEEIKDLIKEVASGKANKWVEGLLIGIGYVIGVGFLGYLGTLIYKATISLK